MGCTNQKSIILSNGKKLYFTNESEKYKVIFVIKNPCSHKESSIYKQICEEFNYNYLSTGDILERICSEKSQKKEYENIIEKVKNGDLITSKEMVNILKNEIIKFDNYKYILIDGFPRNIENIIEWESIMNGIALVKKVLYIKITDEEIKKRLDDDYKLKQTINEKLEKQINIYNDNIISLTEKYKNENLLIEIDGMKKEEEIFKNLYQKFIKNKLF